jgi:predicted  nucleic acid-binding Zn-ribbon protein
MPKEDINPKFRSEENRDPPKYTFRRPSEEETSLTEVLAGLLQRLKTLDKERTDITDEIERLSEEAEKEAENMERELSTLKEQAVAVREVLETMRSRRRT